MLRLSSQTRTRTPPLASWLCPGKHPSIFSTRPRRGSFRKQPMSGKFISRRNILKSLTIGAAVGSVMQVIPLEAAKYAHGVIAAEKTGAAGGYQPKYFPPQQYKTLQVLCDTIFPADADSKGAVEAGAPEFIDLHTSENPEYQA